MILPPQLPECWDYRHVLHISGAKGKKRPSCVLSVLSVSVHSYNLYIPFYSSYLAKNKVSETFADYWPVHDVIIYWLEGGGITSGLSSVPLLVDFQIIYFPHMCVGAHMLWHKCGQRTTCGSPACMHVYTSCICQ